MVEDPIPHQPRGFREDGHQVMAIAHTGELKIAV
jgi:hypothetical protein